MLTATGADVSSTAPDDTWDVPLFKNVVVSEQGSETIEYKDNAGKLIQKDVQNDVTSYLSTHYIYDDFGRVKYIIQPESFETSQSFVEDDAYFKEGVFAYRYDNRGRIIEKHVPGGGWTSFVYDKLDREVWSQSSYQAASGRWSYKKYDALSRLTMSGEKSEGRSRNALQTEVDAISTYGYETRNTTDPLYYSLNNGYPTVTAGDIYTINYYDSYGFSTDSNISNPVASNISLLTGIRSKNQSTNDWNVNSYLYDEKNRIIEDRKAFSTQSTATYVSLLDYIDYTFSGEISLKETSFQNATNTYGTQSQYIYDHAGRKTQLNYAIGNNLTISLFPMANYSYDKIGRNIQKKLRPDRAYSKVKDYINRPTDGTISTYSGMDISKKAITLSPNFTWDATDTNQNGTYLAEAKPGIDETGLQVMDYAYHIRGSLLGINVSDNAVGLFNEIIPHPNTAEGDLFAFRLQYDFDGNIDKQSWGIGFNQAFDIKNDIRRFHYAYDYANRLIYHGSSNPTNTGSASDLIHYDKNGNITSLTRYGKNGNNLDLVDDLTYAYDGNQLLSVSDAVTGNTDIGDFRDGNTSGNDYEYWPDGSLKKDLNKGISQIDYDTYLKLPIQVTRTDNSWVKFFYDGTGAKIKMSTSDGHETHYYREFLLEKNLTTGQLEMYQVSNDEGRNLPDGSGGWRQEYYYRDHLGNIRLSFRDSLAAPVNNIYFPPVITQISSPEPFGLDIKELKFENSIENFYKFQGKEKINALGWHDFGARMYDPAIGRWNAVDIMAEKTFHLSPYIFANNNPINMIDRDGKYAVSVHYNITYKTLIGLGYSKDKADLIAHYASTYADHPPNGARFGDFMLHPLETNTHPYRKGIDYSKTLESQEEKNSHWHSMMSDAEAEAGMTEEQATRRGLKFGWDNIFASNGGEDLGKLGQGLHALQDAIAHGGVKTKDHLGWNMSSAGKFYNDLYGSTKQATSLTKSALIVVDILKGKKVNLKDGDKLNVTGMSGNQLKQVLESLVKQGFEGNIKMN